MLNKFPFLTCSIGHCYQFQAILKIVVHLTSIFIYKWSVISLRLLSYFCCETNNVSWKVTLRTGFTGKSRWGKTVARFSSLLHSSNNACQKRETETRFLSFLYDYLHIKNSASFTQYFQSYYRYKKSCNIIGSE